MNLIPCFGWPLNFLRLDLEINAECKNAEKMQNMHAYYMYYNILLYVKPCHGHVTSKFYHHAKKLQEISFK